MGAIELGDDDFEQVRRLAKQTGLTEEEVVMLAVRQLLQQPPPPTAPAD